MYPGHGKGLRHEIQPGVNAIVGINGVGKTTLLNVLLRSILGVYDPKKADAKEPGAKLHQLVRPSKFNYFAARIGGDARPARATIEISFGGDRLTVVRDLGPKLEILALRHNRSNQIPSDGETLEERYLELVRELSGIQSHYDFDFVVRNLLFFLEEKVPLIWNPKGQFEILRILFLDDELSAEASKLHDSVMQLDSQFRNRNYALGQSRARHAALAVEMGQAPEQTITLQAARAAFSGVRDRCEQLETDLFSLSAKVDTARAHQFAVEQEVNEHARHLESIEVHYLRRSFPDMDARAELVYGSLLTGGGCPLCGTEDQQVTKKLKGLISASKCPCCESALAKGDRVVHVSNMDARRMKETQAQLKAASVQASAAADQLRQFESELSDTREAMLSAHRERNELSFRIRKLEASQAPGDGEFDQLTQALRREEAEVEALRLDRTAAQSKYDAVLTKARVQIEKVADAVVQNFDRFSKSFLSEKAQLSYELHNRSVGQMGPQMSFPSFTLKMSSGAAPVASERQEAEEVSESQKEFVDLAFRMAILEVCRERAGAGMLVIETPESSLDSVFVDRAGDLLRSFANQAEGDDANIIIASTNLNRENMLGRLLGVTGTVRGVAKQAVIRKKIVNLLDIAAETAAYRRYKAVYDKSLEDAIGFPFH